MNAAEFESALWEELSLILGHEVEPTEDLLVEGGLDSFGIMQVVVFLEENYDITLPDAALVTSNFATPSKIASWAGPLLGIGGQ